jgi:hypothetical protein
MWNTLWEGFLKALRVKTAKNQKAFTSPDKCILKLKWQEGIREHGYWIDLTGNRAFYLYEVEDPKVLLAANDYWTDVAKCESVPVMEAEEVSKLMSKA